MAEEDVRWALVTDARRFELPLGVRLVAGRGPDAPVQLPPNDNSASRYHAALEASISGVQVVDLDSRNGVFVNDARVPTAFLGDGEVLRLGATAFRVLREALAEPFVLQQRPRLAPDTVPAGLLGTLKAVPYVCEVCRRDGPVPAIDHEAWWSDVEWLCPSCAESRRTRPETWEVPRPSRLGEFELLRFVARGGMGAVYEGRHERAGIRAAVKVMLPERAIDRIAVKRFTKEQKIIGQLVHQRIVRSIEVGTSEQGELFVATEFMSRGDADALSSPTSDVRTVVGIAADMFEALAFAHANGFVHRDIKPSNLLLAAPQGSRQRAKLGDFGLAKNFRDIGGTILTKEGEIAGSAAFIAPEQLLGFRDVGPTADVYSAAASLYYLLTGDLPLQLSCKSEDATEPQMCLAALADARVPVLQRRPTLHPYLGQWIDLLVCRDHTRRAHVEAASVATTLQAALKQM
jgi:hypothetical protein